jgi:amino acid adenylation domain-containing protein
MPGTSLFNLNQAHRFSMMLVPQLLERSLNEVVRRHEILRTTFHVVGGDPVQVVAKESPVRLPVIDLSTLAEHLREQQARQLATEEARLPFDLARGPLLRTKLLRMAKDRWVFLLTMHHIIADGWTMVLFWRELGAIWRAYGKGQNSPLPEPVLQYGDFATWQRGWLTGPVLQRQMSYWRRQLEGVHPVELPLDRPRSGLQTNSGALYDFCVSASLVSGLQELSRKSGTTLFMVLLSAFQLLLYRYTGETDVTVGTYIAGRNRAELECLLGFFLNTLTLRVDLSGDPTFFELLARVKDTTLDAYVHQDVPFAKIVEELQPHRDLNRNPFFQVVFQMLNLPPVSQHAEAVDAPQIPVHRGTAIFDLTFTLWESGKTLKGHVEYNTDIFNADTIARYVTHYKTLLGGVAEDPEQHISRLPIITSDERRLAMRTWNNTRVVHDDSHSISELFQLQAAASPNATALVDGQKRVCFHELSRRVNQFARYLRTRGLGTEVLACIFLDRSLEAVIAMLAVIEAGGAFMLLDPNYPKERTEYMLEDSRPRLTITKSKWAKSLGEHAGQIVCIDTEAQQIARESSSSIRASISPNFLAYVVYTSGSTGKPKGAAIEHKQILNRLAWMWRACPFQSNETCCQKTSLNFVDSIWEILGPLLKGVPLVIVPDSALRDLSEFARLLESHSVTRIWVVPSLLRAFLENIPDLQSRLPNLRFWVTTGEALTVDLLKEFRARMTNGLLCNLYGTSEVWDATWYETSEGDLKADRVSIGFPIDNVQCYVLDDSQEILPAGSVGELYVGGVGVGRCYLNQPAFTAERFVPDPFSEKSGMRMYRTGDLARWRPDGAIELVGRIDHQVKVRGFRVELSEIESILEQHATVEQAVVIPEVVGGDSRLHAYVVARDLPPTAAQLRAFIKERGPDHLVPASFTMIESMPLLPNGKTDRAALATRARQSCDDLAPFHAPPENPIEETIASVWRSILNLDRVGIDDNFFDLGGHSLLMTRVHLKLTEEFGTKIPVLEVFRYPTIRSLALFLGRERAKSAGDVQE